MLRLQKLLDGSSSSSASDTKKPSTTKTQFCDVLQLAKKFPVTVNVRLEIESLGGRVAQDTRDAAAHDAPAVAGGLLLWMLVGRQAGHLALLLAIVRTGL